MWRESVRWNPNARVSHRILEAWCVRLFIVLLLVNNLVTAARYMKENTADPVIERGGDTWFSLPNIDKCRRLATSCLRARWSVTAVTGTLQCIRQSYCRYWFSPLECCMIRRCRRLAISGAVTRWLQHNSQSPRPSPVADAKTLFYLTVQDCFWSTATLTSRSWRRALPFRLSKERVQDFGNAGRSERRRLGLCWVSNNLAQIGLSLWNLRFHGCLPWNLRFHKLRPICARLFDIQQSPKQQNAPHFQNPGHVWLNILMGDSTRLSFKMPPSFR